MLPWARNSTGSSELSVSGTTQTSNPNASDRSKMNARNVANLATNLPPSPISSAESPVNRKPGEHDPITAGGMDLGERFPDASHKKKTSSRGSKTSLSNASTTTSEDDDADSSRRRDYTFSIYDVYGRDSVAFPNFSYKEVNGKGKRVSQWAGSTEPVPSLRIDTEAMPSAPGLGSRQAKNGPETSPSTASEPTTPRDPRRPGLAPIRTGDIDPGSIPAALRSPSGRRPNAAPDPRGLPGPAAGARGLNVNVASSLRRQVEAGSSCAPATSSPVTSDAQEHERQPSSPRVGGPGAFDPRRRPSAPNVGPPGPVRQGDPGRFPGPPTPRQMTGPPPPGFHQANVGPSRGLPRPGPGGFGFNQMMPGPNPGQPQPPGSGFGPGQIVGPRGPMAAGHGPSGPSGPLGLQAPMQRPRFAAGRGRPRSQSLSNAQLGLDLAKDGDSSSSVSPGPPSPLGLIDSRPPSGPSRAASDRSSERERGGSKDLRKNPSNPTPGVHGGLSVASASRSPSPFSGSDGRVGSARGTPDATSGGPSPSAGAPTSGSGK